MDRVSNDLIVQKLVNVQDKELYNSIVQLLKENSTLQSKYGRFKSEVQYLRSIINKHNIVIDTVKLDNIINKIRIDNITDIEIQKYIDREKDNLLKQTELEKQKLLEEAEYLRLKENKDLRESVNRLTSENSKLKRKLKRENNTK
jgi:hypothetical protein